MVRLVSLEGRIMSGIGWVFGRDLACVPGRFSTVCMLRTGEPVSLGAFAFLEISHHWELSKGHRMG